MAAEIFTSDWALLWNDAINANADYKKAATKWEGAIGLMMTVDGDMGIPSERIVIADLWHGDCRGATVARTPTADCHPQSRRGAPSRGRPHACGQKYFSQRSRRQSNGLLL